MNTRIIGMVAAAALLCGSALVPTAALGSEPTGDDAVASQQTAMAGGTSADGDSTTEAMTDALNASVASEERLANAQAGQTKATDATGDPGGRDALKTLLQNTEEKDLKPLASGYRADDSGTAPYDSVKPNADDLAKLNEARDAAQKIVDDASATADDVTKASDALQKAFDAVRFIYHYTGISGTAGARIYDNNGNLIQAHGAGIQKAKTSLLAKDDQKLDKNGDGYVYIWCGEDKTDRLVAHGVRIYYSDDLYNWTDKGLGFQTYLGDQDLKNKMAGADPVYQKYYNVENIEHDPDYTNIYGKDFQVFAHDKSNYDIDSPQDALDKLLWDLKALYGDGSNPTKTSCVFERPKIVYNEHTNRWIVWFHADGPQYGNEDTATYSKAKAGVAVSTTGDPAGPYKYLGSFRMSPGTNESNPGMARDMNVYVDDKDENGDEVKDAYLIYASNENRDLTISLLDSTYTKLVKPVAEQQMGTSVKNGDTYNIIATNSKESPAPVKWNGHYYFIYSHTTGWAPNENEYTISEGDNIMGPYHEIGTPFVDGTGPNQSHTNSFYTQSSSIIPVDPQKGLFIYWGDRWFNPDTGNDISQSRYVMVPMQFVGTEMRVMPAVDWTLEDLQQYEAVTIKTQLPTETGSMSELMAKLPKTLNVQVGDDKTTATTPVTWDPYYGADQPAGSVTVTGHLPELHNVEIHFTVTVYPKNTVLFMDAGSDAANESDYYTSIVRNAPNLINRDHSDQLYSEGGWGLASTVGVDVEKYGASSNDIYETGYYALGGKNVQYRADLKAGSYSVTAGFKEWWAQWNERKVKFTVSADGKDLASTQLTPSGSGSSTNALTFTLDQDATVTFTAARGDGEGKDPYLSWISVVESDPKDVASVAPVEGTVGFLAGTTPTLPDTATVTLNNGTTETRDVTWHYDADSIVEFHPTEVRGSVEGTTLPAVATVQKIPAGLGYFIDVNGGENSPTYANAKKLTKGGLTNAKADQAFDEAAGWGNASVNYGTENTGSADPFDSGIYAGKNGKADQLSYKLTLAPGTHTVTLGFHDWWNQSRPTTVTYQMDGMGEPAELTSTTVTSAKTSASGTIVVPDGDPRVVTITLTSPQGTGPVLSWISTVKQEKQPTPVSAKEVTVNATVGDDVAAKLPKTVTVTYSDNSTKDVAVTWDQVDWASQPAGTVTVKGTLEGIAPSVLQATATVTLSGSSGEPGEPQTPAGAEQPSAPTTASTGAAVAGIVIAVVVLAAAGVALIVLRHRRV
ncbi:Ig-like domain-containing protein [Bifidobacterium pullorum subsp. saeculare]|uniref:Ig-like domain-containing protein n=1 Tax=Bifidobacterium pullorum subsp. saeculare TaxID=78257 RepID=A0A938X0G3_9BIFI|nr:Ig-like domain-containing protein [Bifidobacterium pullorum]MBM6700418.1 Ig-like domain-containing protein [Bifidobacterium pullorum subsp. saeculare]